MFLRHFSISHFLMLSLVTIYFIWSNANSIPTYPYYFEIAWRKEEASGLEVYNCSVAITYIDSPINVWTLRF